MLVRFVSTEPQRELPVTVFKTPSEKNVLQFQEYLINNKLTVFIRKKLGQDIAGACGQLAADYKGADAV